MGCCRSRQRRVLGSFDSDTENSEYAVVPVPAPACTNAWDSQSMSPHFCQTVNEDGEFDENAVQTVKSGLRSRAVSGRMSLAKKFRDSLASLVSIGSLRVHALHEHMVVMNPGKIKDFWVLNKEVIGKGAHGSVCIGENKNKKGLTRAVKKCFKVRERDHRALRREVNVMKLMDHPNVIRLFEVFEDRRCLYFVLELCSGGELMERVVQKQSITEKDSALIAKQVLRGVAYMHEKYVAHRDLKPENFLLSDTNPLERSTLKIIDFGCAAQVLPGTHLNTRAGTPFYMAPEMLLGDFSHDLSCDNWSIGVVMFFLLCGQLPFQGHDQADVFEKVKTGEYSFNSDSWQYVCERGKELVANMLEKDQKKRITAQKALRHDWVKGRAQSAIQAPPQGLMDNLKQFQTSNRLKKAALHSVARQINTSKIQELEAVFFEMDVNGDGHVSLAELEKGLETIGAGLSQEQLTALVETVDTDGDGQVAYTEFIAAAIDLQEVAQEDVLWSAFCTFDRNGDGKISEAELQYILEDAEVQSVLCVSANRSSIRKMLDEADATKDGFIDFEEFMAVTRPSHNGCGRGSAMTASRHFSLRHASHVERHESIKNGHAPAPFLEPLDDEPETLY